MKAPTAISIILSLVSASASSVQAAPPLYDEWETFDTRRGLPSDKVLCVCATDRAVWVGTDRGLARYDGRQWHTYGREDGLAHPVVMAITEDPETGDVWVGTLGGLSRFTAGRFDTFTQFNSGLSNDVVYGLTTSHGEVWAATAAGTSRYDPRTHQWTLYDEKNTPMHEIWCYGADACGDKVYLAVWGGGLLEYDRARNRWRDYRDPDGEMEIDLFRNDGLVHDVVASVACDRAGIVWVGTYFGLSTYDGRKWLNFMDHDPPVGGLASNFINFVTAHDGYGWIATDNGLNATDRKSWWTYRRDPNSGRGIVLERRPDGSIREFTIDTIFPHNYLLGIAFQGDDIWVATEKGVSVGRRSRHALSTSTQMNVSRQ